MTVSEIVLKDYRTAEVFKRYGISYCCKGDVSLQEACLAQDLDMELLQKDLERASRVINLPPTVKFEEWSVEFLVDYILNIHHSYIKQTVPELNRVLRSFVSTHKEKYPYIFFVEEAFNDLGTELLEHIEHEEESIFPYLKLVSTTHKRREIYGSLFVRTLSKPLSLIIESEHKRIAILLQQLRKTTNNYTFAGDVCPIHQVLYNKLKEFDADVSQHKGLEDSILYPKTISMEKELLMNV